MDSDLNPEAPEFYPNLTSLTQGGYITVQKTVTSSNILFAGSSYDLFKTFTDFNVVTSQLSENVIIQSNHILSTEQPAVKLRRNDKEYNMERILDVNDTMIDRININIDNVSGENEPNKNFINTMKSKPNVASWNKDSVITKIQFGSTTLIGAKNILRPQINFKDQIDNTESLWIPKISDKPNSITPLYFHILYNEHDEAIGFEHPYKVELDLYHPPAKYINLDLKPVPFPLPMEKTSYTYIDTEEQLDVLVNHLVGVNEIAIDVEHHSYRTYQGITCIIQISTYEGGDFIIDTLVIREHIHKLNLAFTDPKIIKVFHGSRNDILWLQRDFGVYVVGLFDTHEAAKMLKLAGFSLKYLLMRYCQVDIDKKYQLADWRIRPLPEEMVEYARSDTHYLLYVWRQMRIELLTHAAGQPHLLFSVFEQSRQICGTTYNKEVITDNSHMSLYLGSYKSFNTRQMAALKMLYKWRDSQARVLDESTAYLIPNHMLLSLAEALPREVQGVNACCDPMPPFVKQNLITIHKMILSCRELPIEQLYQMPTGIPSTSAVTTDNMTDDMHDNIRVPEFSQNSTKKVKVDRARTLHHRQNYYGGRPDIKMFKFKTAKNDNECVVSDLNADAKQFVPPYERYKKYRLLSQTDDMKKCMEREAKVEAIGKGNEMIQTEILDKLHHAKMHIENEDDSHLMPGGSTYSGADAPKNSQQRKRKLSSKEVPMNSKATGDESENKKKGSNNTFKKNGDEEPFKYKNIDYKQFFTDMNK